MKNLYIHLFTLLSLTLSFSQTVSIPDTNFKKALINQGLDKNKDGEIQRDEVADLINLNVSNKGISDLTGIQAFSGLFSLNCSQNTLTTIDFSKNSLLTQINASNNNLSRLDLYQNPMLSSLRCDYNQIDTMDLASNSSLTILSCSNNLLTTLNVSFLNLYMFNCAANQISTLDLSKSSNLSSFSASSNLLTGTLDLSYSPTLNDISCDYNLLTALIMPDSVPIITLRCNNNKLTALKISDKTNLTTLIVSGNQIQTLNIATLTKLTQFSCTSNKITSLDFSHSPELYSLYCGINNITTLDVSKNTKLTNLNCNSTKITSLDITKNTVLTQLNTQGNAQLPYICVNDVAAANNNSNFVKDANTQYTTTCSVVTDLSSIEATSEISISPNPSTQDFYLQIPTASEVQVMNSEGKTQNTFYDVTTLNFGDTYKAGIYFVNIKGATSSKVIRVIKQ